MVCLRFATNSNLFELLDDVLPEGELSTIGRFRQGA